MKHGVIAIILFFSVQLCKAANPASTGYVDKKFAAIQQQIDTISTIAAIKHPVGSCLGGGVVFYTNPNINAPVGQRGLIVAVTDAALGVAWDASADTTVNNTLPGYFTGLNNTQNILETDNGTAAPQWPAADVAAAYNTTHNASCPGETCSPWYLPSQYELSQFYLTSFSVVNFGGGCTGYQPITGGAYWTSTQVNNTSIWIVDFDNGYIYGGNGQLNVRAVRYF